MTRLSLLAPLALASCIDTTAPQPPVIGMANPASVHCIALGGETIIRDEPDGQAGYCRLPDGRVVDEWVLYRQSQDI